MQGSCRQVHIPRRGTIELRHGLLQRSSHQTQFDMRQRALDTCWRLLFVTRWRETCRMLCVAWRLIARL